MQKLLLSAALVFSGLFFTSCDQFGKEKEIGEAIPTEEYDTFFASLKESTEQEGKRVSYEGYLYIGSDITIQDYPGIGDNLAAVSVFSEPLGEGKMLQFVLTPFGDSKNTVTVPDQFSDEDLIVNTHTGEKLAYNQKVKISGTVTYPKKEGSLNSSTQKTEYPFFLTDIRFDKAE